MTDEVFDIVSLAFNSGFGWFQTLLDSVDMFEAVMGVILISAASRFLLLPLFNGGFGGSDKSKKSSSKKSSSKNSSSKGK